MTLGYAGLCLNSFFAGIFMGLGQVLKNSLAHLVYGLSCILFIIVFWFLGWINLCSVFLVYPLSAIVTIVVFLGFVDFGMLFPFHLEKRHFCNMLNFARWLIFGVTAVYLVNWGDLLVLRFFVSRKDIAVYNFGYQFFKSGVLSFIYILGAYFLPFVSKNINNPEKMNNYLNQKRPKIILLGIACIGVIFFLAPYIINLMYANRYQGWVTIFRILLIYGLFVLYYIFYNPVLTAMKSYRFLTIANIGQVALNLFLDVVLIPILGIQGAAVATTSASLCFVVTVEIYFRVKVRKLLGIWSV
jgi:O-antigen/teichoic acid export membrane protein